LARIVVEKYLLVFCTEATIYSEIMQSIQKQQNNSTHQNGIGELSAAAARRSSKIGDGARKLTATALIAVILNVIINGHNNHPVELVRSVKSLHWL